MKYRICLISLIVLLSTLAVSQAAPAPATPSYDKFEVYAGAQYRYAAGVPLQWDKLGLGFNFAGWEAAGTYKFNPHFGITADTDGFYNTLNAADLYVGPSVYLPKGSWTFFAHAMPGFNHLFGAGLGNTGFSIASGGGVDVAMGKKVALRIAQVDWIWNQNSHGTSNLNQSYLRYSGGLVFKF